MSDETRRLSAPVHARRWKPGLVGAILDEVEALQKLAETTSGDDAEAVAAMQKRWDRIDALVNNAAYPSRVNP